ncbi:hypothetical protein EV401DRAFT_757591 [Pisolithus croceorrhizus]|nr:hypothetical protein EV401DRAFT_757591 [Pisolithus croceorrhizus]
MANRSALSAPAHFQGYHSHRYRASAHHQSQPEAHVSTSTHPHAQPHPRQPMGPLHHHQPPHRQACQPAHSHLHQLQPVSLVPPELAQVGLVTEESGLAQRWTSFMRESGFFDGYGCQS